MTHFEFQLAPMISDLVNIYTVMRMVATVRESQAVILITLSPFHFEFSARNHRDVGPARYSEKYFDNFPERRGLIL